MPKSKKQILMYFIGRAESPPQTTRKGRITKRKKRTQTKETQLSYLPSPPLQRKMITLGNLPLVGRDAVEPFSQRDRTTSKINFLALELPSSQFLPQGSTESRPTLICKNSRQCSDPIDRSLCVERNGHFSRKPMTRGPLGFCWLIAGK